MQSILIKGKQIPGKSNDTSVMRKSVNRKNIGEVHISVLVFIQPSQSIIAFQEVKTEKSQSRFSEDTKWIDTKLKMMAKNQISLSMRNTNKGSALK